MSWRCGTCGKEKSDKGEYYQSVSLVKVCSSACQKLYDIRDTDIGRIAFQAVRGINKGGRK